jgi:hypothetical protein
MNKLDIIILAALVALALVCIVVLALTNHQTPDQLWAALTTLIGALAGRMFPSAPAPSIGGDTQ